MNYQEEEKIFLWYFPVEMFQINVKKVYHTMHGQKTNPVRWIPNQSLVVEII